MQPNGMPMVIAPPALPLIVRAHASPLLRYVRQPVSRLSTVTEPLYIACRLRQHLRHVAVGPRRAVVTSHLQDAADNHA